MIRLKERQKYTLKVYGSIYGPYYKPDKLDSPKKSDHKKVTVHEACFYITNIIILYYIIY